jgi:hypothetical protein
MKLNVKPVSTDLFYHASFEEPMIEHVKAEKLASTVNKLARTFALRLNDIKVTNEAPSDNFLHFSKFDGPSFFDVSFGLEEVSARLRQPQNEQHATDLYNKLSQFFDQATIKTQRMNVGQQLSTQEDAASFLESLNPNVPGHFQQFLQGSGVYYTLRIPDNQLAIYITLVSSMSVAGGLYLSIENEFSPNLYDFEGALVIVKGRRDFIMKELNLNMEPAM